MTTSFFRFGEAPLGIKDVATSARRNLISVLPNPASQSLQIDLLPTASTEQVQIYVYDAVGRLVYAQPFTQRMVLDISSWSHGAYFIVARDAESVQTEQVLKW